MLYKKECLIDGCEKTNIAAKGLCHMHYARMRRHGNLDAPEYMNDNPCSVAGCNETARSSGMCHMHFMRYSRYGDPSITKKKSKYTPSKTCVMKNCDKPEKAHNLCHRHYHNFMYHVRKKNITKNVYEYLKYKEALS